MKLTKFTNKIRIESSNFRVPEVYNKLANGQWMIVNGSSLGLKFDPVQFQGRLYHDEKMGYQIFDISEDDV